MTRDFFRYYFTIDLFIYVLMMFIFFPLEKLVLDHSKQSRLVGLGGFNVRKLKAETGLDLFFFIFYMLSITF